NPLGRKLGLGSGIVDVAEWRKQRASKSLYELQIEVCEKAIKGVANASRVPQDEKDLARKQIEAEIANLKKTKKPVFLQGDYMLFEKRGRYNADLAKRVREGIKSGKYGNLGIIK